jgi:hypothetical protein
MSESSSVLVATMVKLRVHMAIVLNLEREGSRCGCCEQEIDIDKTVTFFIKDDINPNCFTCNRFMHFDCSYPAAYVKSKPKDGTLLAARAAIGAEVAPAHYNCRACHKESISDYDFDIEHKFEPNPFM